MVNHGLATGAMFAMLAFLIDRYRSTQQAHYGGLKGRFPNVAVLAVVATFGILLSAWNVMTMLQRVFFNPPKEPPPAAPDTPPGDVNRRECFALGTLAGLCLLLGLFPQVLLDPMRGDTGTLAAIGDHARARVAGTKIPEPPRPDGAAPAVAPRVGGPPGRLAE